MRYLKVRRLWGRWVATSVKPDYKEAKLYGMGAWGRTRVGALLGLAKNIFFRGYEPWAEGGSLPGTEVYVTVLKSNR